MSIPAAAGPVARPEEVRSAPRVDNADWPGTRRLGPWLGIALVIVVFLVPIDSVKLPIPLPVDARPDRIVIGLFLVLAIGAHLTSPSSVMGGHRYGVIDMAILAFVTIAVVSVAINLPALSSLNEADETIKKFALLLSYGAFYLFLVNVLRPSEVPALVVVLVGVAAVAALGTMLQYATGTNFFFLLSDRLLPGATVSSYTLLVTNGRPDITGPARHGLAISTMLGMIMPFAVAGAIHARKFEHRRMFAIAAAIILMGCLTTLRRSGVILPLSAGLVVVALGGRRSLPVLVGGVVIALALIFVAPGIAQKVKDQFSSDNASARQSISGRTDDYQAIQPDLRARSLLGRGYESYNAKRYRFVDNEYLQTVIGVGVVGLLSYLVLMGIAARSAEQVRRRARSPDAQWIAAACLGSTLAFVLANALFDALAFPQAPYAFFTVLAIVALLARDLTFGDQGPGGAAALRSSTSSSS